MKSSELSVGEVVAHCSENTVTSESGRRHSLFSGRSQCSGMVGQVMQKVLTPFCARKFSFSLGVNSGKVSVGKRRVASLIGPQ